MNCNSDDLRSSRKTEGWKASQGFHRGKTDLFNTDKYDKKIFISQVLISLCLTGGTVLKSWAAANTRC